ncbi:glutathione ABC transporter substrate-binding protein [Natronincola ferrireducens]|uniref:Peptide/nickel transport system substrate-binding protein n=1 Tax=Natronincola ferrireducens TaxID=393762 RepID=A0A1G9GX81_9FIRM|nr:glutathione ABC transporter substrate-binding protein [Natronincola ferrireducens]SDL05276.1 peptide/nickel transport system substrate-binding protein [Natronincola ferrireducens]
MKKRMLAGLLSIALLLTACGSSTSTTSEAGDTKKDVLVVAQGADPKSLDPQATTDAPAGRVSSQIFENLVEQDEDMNVVPGLAESWDIVDGNTYVFHLRKGVKFHNGEELTANDVMYTFKRAAASPHAKSIMATIDVEECKVLDENTFEMKLSKPFGPILAHLAHNVLAIVNEKAIVEAGDAAGQKPVGTGPYKFSKWATGDRIELTRNDEYWGEKAKIKDIVIRTIPETASRTIELETGGIDVAIDVLPNDISRIEENPNTSISRSPDFSTNFIVLTCTQGPLQDVRVRQAINMAVNTDAIINVVYQGTGTKGSGPMSPTIWAHNSNIPQYEYNVEKAKQLLADAGYADGMKLSITTSDHQQRVDTCEMLQNQLKAVGIDLEISVMEWGAFLEKVYAGSLEMFALGWSAATGDPDYALYSQYHSSNHGESGNMAFYTNEDVDALLDKGRDATDENERKEAYLKAQELIMKDAPCIFLQHGEKIAGYTSALTKFNTHPSGTFNFSKFEF